MSKLIGPLINIVLTVFPTIFIRFYPLKDKLRVSVKSIAAIWLCIIAAQCATFVFLGRYFTIDIVSTQLYRIIVGSLNILLPFFLIKKSFLQSLFLLALVTNLSAITVGAGSYIEANYGGAFAASYPLIISDALMIAIWIPFLPFLLRFLKKMFVLLRGSEKMYIWKVIWIVPALFFAFAFISGNIFTEGAVMRPLFIVVRILIGVAMFFTLYLLTSSLQQEIKNATLQETARMTEQLLALQREQYVAMTKNSDLVKTARHDLRHQLAVLKSYGSAGDLQKLNAYLDELTGGVKNDNEDSRFCDNYAVNAIVRHYLSIAKNEDIEIDIRLDIPEKTGQVPEMDLCIIMGNLLENALEACRRMQDGRRFVRVRSKAQNDYLSITVDNSFDGVYREYDGVYLSRKHEGEGIGLSSVRAITEKYEGLAEFRVNGNMFLSSALVTINGKVNQEQLNGVINGEREV